MSYRGRAPRPRARVLAQLVDEATGTVLSNIVTPVPLHLDGRRRTVSLPLEIVSAGPHLRGARFTLQLTAQSSQYDVRPAGGVGELLAHPRRAADRPRRRASVDVGLQALTPR